MKKILSIGQKEITSGLAHGKYLQNTGMWATAQGMNHSIQADNLLGLIAGCSAPTEIVSASLTAGVVDVPVAATSRVTAASTGHAYILGASGHFYDLNTSTFSLSDLRSGTPITNPANGIEIFRPSTGTEYLYYWQQGQIGRWDLAGTYATGWTDNWVTGLNSTSYHPTRTFLDAVFYGNLNYIGKIYDDGTATTAHNGTVLDLPKDYTVTCLADDGQFLVIGATKNKGDATLYAETRILFWDTNSSSWQKEYKLDDPSINAIGKQGNALFAITSRGVYSFNFATEPTMIRQLSTQEGVSYGYPEAVDNISEALIFGNDLTTYGKLHPTYKNGWAKPFFGLDQTGGNNNTVSMLFSNARFGYLLVGQTTPTLWYFNTTTNGAPSKQWDTIYFDLGQTWRIQQLDFIIPNGLASGDAVSVSVTGTSGSTACTAVSYANHGAVYRVKTTPTQSVETDMLQLNLTMTGGVPAIARIDVWGTPVNLQ